MKKKYTAFSKVIVLILIILVFAIGIDNYIKYKHDSGYSFKCVERNKYEVTEGSNYVGLICDFSNSSELVFQNEIFKYELNGYKGDYRLKITYPDGGFTDYSDVNKRESGSNTKYDSEFISAAIKAIKLIPSPKHILRILFAFIIGIVQLIYPEFIFELNVQWKYKKLEASDSYLIFMRVIGGIFIGIGIYGLYVFWSCPYVLNTFRLIMN